MKEWHSDDGRVVLYHADCRDVLPTLKPVETCITDPPYGIAFMGKQWDTPGALVERKADTTQKWDQVGGNHHPCNAQDRARTRLSEGKKFQAQALEWFEVIGTVLKPGASLLAFGGTRTWHRLACAIEDAGFELKDSLAWLYGCLSDDTEILVDGEWVPYQRATKDRLALCYDVEHDEFSWQPIENTFVYEYSDTAYRVESDYTDQIVSRNHRCLVERDGAYVFELAEEIAQEQEVRVPILEGLPALLNHLSMPHTRAGKEESFLLQQLWVERQAQMQAKIGKGNDSGGLCGLRETGLEAQCTFTACGNPDVFQGVQWRSTWAGVERSCVQGAGSLDREIKVGTQRPHDGRVEPCLEGGRNVPEAKGGLWFRKVCSLFSRICSHGSERRVCNGTSSCGGESIGSSIDQKRSGASRGPRFTKQLERESVPIFEQSRPQTVRASRYTRADLARITPVYYEGIVWCVQVPTGAFVARRNGKVFVTGNSGFPKSHNISKAIDAAAGAEREVVGVREDFARRASKKWVGCNPYDSNVKDGSFRNPQDKGKITAPATDEAKLWDGWGSSLKPSHEPILLAMKPLDGTYVNNALTHGVAGLNIDGCRIGSESRVNGPASTARVKTMGRPEHSGSGWNEDHPASQVTGRWPANVVLDEEAAKLLDEKSDGVSRFFYTSKASRAERSGNGDIENKHATVKPLDLMRWLCRLTATPTKGTVLDPFMGSGTTGVAAVLEGRSFIGIELEEESFWTAVERIKHAGALPSEDAPQNPDGEKKNKRQMELW